MFSRLNTVSFQGMDVITIDVEVKISSGLPKFPIVGLPDKAVAESRERVGSAFISMGLPLPYHRITANLAPADCKRKGAIMIFPLLSDFSRLCMPFLLMPLPILLS